MRAVSSGQALQRESLLMNHYKPLMTRMLQSLGLDIVYHRGVGNSLYYLDEQQREVEVLDLVGGYGANFLGHNHPKVIAEAQRVMLQQLPVFAQGAIRPYAQKLARELSDRAGGDYCCVFANSGTEAVEAALKHALLESDSQTFFALEGGFHGKTLGALQLTLKQSQSPEFRVPGIDVVRVRLNDIQHLEAMLDQHPQAAGFVFEAVQGEGGVRGLDKQFARRLKAGCAARGIPLIADECQSGMGRTGRFLACEWYGIRPDYVLLSKSLGGGLAKISALLVDRCRYREAFDLAQTSTFAGDDFSCAVASKTVSLLDDSLLLRCQQQGAKILDGLRNLAASFPGVIKEVRGYGLMLALEFHELSDSPSFLLRYASWHQQLAYEICSVLLHQQRLRAAPTLGSPFSIRIQPSVFIKESEIAWLLKALQQVCRLLAAADSRGLTKHWQRLNPPPRAVDSVLTENCKPFVLDNRSLPRECPEDSMAKVAWLCHMVDANDLLALEPDLATLSEKQRGEIVSRLACKAAPVVMSSVDIRSVVAGSVRLYPILLPVTSHWMKGCMESGEQAVARGLVQNGIRAASELGCSAFSLGQYTSIVTRAGQRLDPLGMRCTTGNSLSVALVIQALERAELQLGRRRAESCLAVVGASGNIGSICAELLAERYQRIMLVGGRSPRARTEVKNLANRIPNAVIAEDLQSLRDAQVVVAATSSTLQPLKPNHLAQDALVCDVSVPAALSTRVSSARPDVTVIKGGIVKLPYGEDLEFVGFPLPRGQTYACMAEGILLGLDGTTGEVLSGSITRETVLRAEGLAAKHGFQLADFKTSCVFGSDEGVDQHAESY